MSHLSSQFLEQIYETVILPQFDLPSDLTRLSWGGHSKLGPDASACRFTLGQDEYVLVFEDYPGLTEQEINRLIAPPGQYLSRQLLYGHGEETEYLRFVPSETPYRYITNVTGSFSLFILLWREREKLEIQPMTIMEVAQNLHNIGSSINADSTPQEIMNAGSYIIGQTVANVAITIEDYTERYPILDDIDGYACSVAIGDGRHDNTLGETWGDLVRCIETFYKQVQDSTFHDYVSKADTSRK